MSSDTITVRTVPEDLPVQYVNSVNVESSLYDFAFDLGVIAGQRDGELIIRVVERVIMSPTHAKALLSILSRHVGAWETRFGEIPTGEPSNAPEDLPIRPPTAARRGRR